MNRIHRDCDLLTGMKLNLFYTLLFDCRSGSIGGQANEDRSDTWSLDAIASDSEADGGRERERQVREEWKQI